MMQSILWQHYTFTIVHSWLHLSVSKSSLHPGNIFTCEVKEGGPLPILSCKPTHQLLDFSTSFVYNMICGVHPQLWIATVTILCQQNDLWNPPSILGAVVFPLHLKEETFNTCQKGPDRVICSCGSCLELQLIGIVLNP